MVIAVVVNNVAVSVLGITVAPDVVISAITVMTVVVYNGVTVAIV